MDYVVISETELDESFLNTQFKLNGYEIRARRDRHKHGGGLIEFVRPGFICKRLKNMNLIVVSVSVLSLQIQRKSESVLVYIGLHQMNKVISKALCKYENLIVMGDFNIDIKSSNSDKDKLENFCDYFNLKKEIEIQKS